MTGVFRQGEPLVGATDTFRATDEFHLADEFRAADESRTGEEFPATYVDALRATGEGGFRVTGEFRETGESASTSPCKGEVGRVAAGRGSRFARTTAMTSHARRLRGGSTDVEKKLWRALRRDQIDGLHFRRQHPIGPYVLDFYCPALRLAIELDGGQHVLRAATDARRTRWLNAKGIVVFRFWNNDVHGNLQGVLSEIVRVAQTRVRRRLSASVKGGRDGSRPPPGELGLADLPLKGGGDEGGSAALLGPSDTTRESN